jgi:hypothetical protein
MTIRALAGVLVFNLVLLGVGTALLWGLGAYRWLTDMVRLSGVAYLAGLAGLIVLLSLELVGGIPITAISSVLTLLALVVIGLTTGIAQRRPCTLRWPVGWRFPRISVFVAVSLAGIVLYLEGLFRQARLATPLAEFDGWWNWIPKAKAIYFFGRLDPELLSFLPNQSYPPGLPAVHAVAFHFMGSADDTTLHVQYWFYAVGFFAAVAGLLVAHVRAAILAPSFFLIFLAPSFITWSTRTYVDFPLGYMVATAALLTVLWIEERRPWQLVTVTALMSAAMLTKREGIPLAACVVIAGLAASAKEWRVCWPRLAVAGVIALALELPWRIWFSVHGLMSDAPSGGIVGELADTGRGWATVKLVASTLVAPDVWRLAPFVGAAAIALALFARAWIPAIYACAFIASAAVMAVWIIWSEVALPITMRDSNNPIVRLTGTSILVLVALTPLLLERAWSAGRGADLALGVLGADLVAWRSLGAWAIVVAAVLVYPASMLAGISGSTLPGGMPHFPSVADCTPPPASGERVRIVVGYADSYPEADRVRARASASGLDGVQVAQDGCGRLRVFVGDFRNIAAADLAMSRARAAGLEPSLEAGIAS